MKLFFNGNENQYSKHQSKLIRIIETAIVFGSKYMPECRQYCYENNIPELDDDDYWYLSNRTFSRSVGSERDFNTMTSEDL